VGFFQNRSNDLRYGLRPDVQQDAGGSDGLHHHRGLVDGRTVDRVTQVDHVPGQACARGRRHNGRQEHRVPQLQQSQVQRERPGRRVHRPDELGQGGVPFQEGPPPAGGASRRLFRSVQVHTRSARRSPRERSLRQLGQAFRSHFSTVSVRAVRQQIRLERP